MNWSDPIARLELIERVGVHEYTKLQKLEHERQIVEHVNGYAIRKVGSPYGTIYMVDGLNKGHRTLEGARNIAKGVA